jgi:hypothetical protein
MDYETEAAVGCLGVVAVIGFVVWIALPSSESDAQRGAEVPAEAPVDETATALPLPVNGERFPVPSDSAATHWLLEWHRMPNGNRHASTRRDGPLSGTIFTRVEIDCRGMRYRVLGQGDTDKEAQQPHPDPGPMREIEHGSIQYWKRAYVCAQQQPRTPARL